MRTHWLFILPLLAAAAPTAASAAILDARFSGTVASQAGTASAVGSTVSGEFIYNTVTSSFVSFTIGGVSIPSGYGSTTAMTPDGYDAQYRAQISAVQQGGSVNETFILDLEGLSPFVQPVLSTSAVALLTNPGELATDLDLASNPNSQFPSTFGYTIGTASTTTSRLTANLASLQVAVPEPASLALLAAACAGIGLRRRRR